MKKSPSYKQLAKSIKALGLIDYDLRRDLSTGQKSRITKLYKEYRHVVNHPEDFLLKRVGKNQRKMLEESGYKVTPKNIAAIPLGRYDSAKLTKNSIVFTKGRIEDETFLNGAPDFFNTADKLSKRKLGKNEYLTVRIGDNAQFGGTANFKSIADLYKYVANWTPKDAQLYGLNKKQTEELRKKLVSKMSIVRYTYEDESKWQKQKAKERAQKFKRK